MTATFLRALGALLGGVALLTMPALVSAQTCTFGACGTGTLFVYVQVLNQYGTPTAVPGNFTVQITGQNPSPASFPGSQSGTTVSLSGGSAYTVSVPQTLGYTPSYSQGCTGTLYGGQQATCVITMSSTPGFYPPQPYPYPYTPSVLSCAPAYQSVPAGQTATFTAQGGTATYNWTTANNTYLGVGSILNTTLQNAGVQTVTVTSGSQTATCTINVTAPSNGPIVYPGMPGFTPLITTNYIPGLPNTGFTPLTSAGIAFGAVVLIGGGIFFYPYVRKAFRIVTR